MNKALINWWAGGGSQYTSEYQAVLDRATALGYTPPSDSVKTKGNALVVALKAAGIWSSLDLFYVFRTDGDVNFALLNWIAPSSYQATRQNSMTFVSGVGFKGNGSNMYLDLNWIPKTNGVTYTLNSSSLFTYHAEAVTSPGTAFGCNDAAGANTIAFVSYSAGNASFFHHAAFGDNIGGGADSQGFWHVQRTAAATSKLFKNGSLFGNGTRTSNDRPSTNMYVGGRNNNGSLVPMSNTVSVGVFGCGGSLSGLEASLDTAWDAYIA